MKRRLLLATPLLLGACASLNTVSCDVSSFGDWPAGRAAGSYAFERLPSQQAQAAEADALEAAARPALQKAGFVPAAAGQEPEVLVQLGGRFTRSTRSAWDDPLWWRGGFGRFRHGPWIGPTWSMQLQMESSRYDSEVALLLRDRASGKPLYETRASLDATSRADTVTVVAMFEAALADFPRLALSPRRVTVALPR
jgi:hypothetical protein